MMQACVAALTILLSGQVEAGRYEQPAPSAAESEAAQQSPMFQYTDEGDRPTAADPTNPLRPDLAAQQSSLASGAVPRTAGEGPLSSYDAAVTPTADPPAGDTAQVPPIKPSDLIETFMRAPTSGGELAGVPIALMDAVADAASRHEQTQVAMAYWDLSAAAADYYLALQELAELESLRASVASPGEAWQAAETQHQLRTTAALRTAQAAQTRLNRLMGEGEAAPLPLPADPPHAGRYDSQYENIFATRDNAVARQLNELLPVEQQNIRHLAAAVMEADNWLALVSVRRSPDTQGEGLLRAHDLLSLRRREFVDAVRHYNHHIAEYSELATPGRVETRRLVAMLIKTSSGSSGPQWQDPDVQQASAQEPETADAGDGGQQRAAPLAQPQRPSTYAPQVSNDAGAEQGFGAAEADAMRVRRPILKLLRDREHSILRRPLSQVRGKLR